MTVGAVGMRVRCNAQQRIVVTIGTTSGSNRDDTGVIRNRRMDVTPNGTVTCCTVAAYCKVFAYRRARQGTVTRMTGSTGIMRVSCCTGQRWWIAMT